MQYGKYTLREYLREIGMSQAELAAKAKVSQSTVSRALRGGTERHSKARHRLCIYAGIRELPVKASKEDAAKRVIRAFDRIWDGSEAHAVSIATVIDALAGLRPVVSTEKRGRIERQRKSTQEAPKKRRPERHGN
jgi:transcriptional regulator with XRE-family HTH domain